MLHSGMSGYVLSIEGLSIFEGLCSMEQELHFHRFERKEDSSTLGAIQYACCHQGCYVAVNRFDVSAHSTGGFPD